MEKKKKFPSTPSPRGRIAYRLLENRARPPMFDSWLAITQHREWDSAKDALSSELEVGDDAERHRRIAWWLTCEWMASRCPDHVAKSLHVVDSRGEHSHLIFCHHLSSCYEAVDEAISQSAGRIPQTNLVVLYWQRGGSTRASVQQRYGGGGLTPLLYPAALLEFGGWEGEVEYRRVRAPPLGDAGEYSRCVTEELHSKPRVLPPDKVAELAQQLPSVLAGARDNLLVGARPNDLQYTTWASGERCLQRVVEGEPESFF